MNWAYAGPVRGIRTSPWVLGGITLLVVGAAVVVYLLLIKPSSCEAWQEDVKTFAENQDDIIGTEDVEGIMALWERKPEGCPDPPGTRGPSRD